MRTGTEVAARQHDALEVILGVLGKYDPQTLERIETDFATRGTKQWSVRSGVVTPTDEHLLILAEALASFAKRIEELEGEIASLQGQDKSSRSSRPRGPRPRKDDAA